MNTASRDLPRHLGILRERMLHPTDYEAALYYFLEEFAGDAKFIGQSDPDDAPHLLAVLTQVVSSATGREVTFDAAKVLRLREHGFYHGNAVAGKHIVLFFYFQAENTGVAMLLPGVRGATDVARFRIPAGLSDPRQN